MEQKLIVNHMKNVIRLIKRAATKGCGFKVYHDGLCICSDEYPRAQQWSITFRGDTHLNRDQTRYHTCFNEFVNN